MGEPARQVFADELAQQRRRRQLLGLLVLAAVAIVAALVTEMAPVPRAVSLFAVGGAFVALAIAARAVVLLGADDRRRRQQAEATIDLTDSLLMVIDTRSRIRLANPAACAVFGRPEAELLGVEIQQLFTADVREASYRAFAEIMAGRLDPAGHRSERRIARPDGSVRTVAWHIAPRRDSTGAIGSLLLSGQDVTDRRERDRQRRRDRMDVDQLRDLLRAIARRDDARPAVCDCVERLTDASFVGLAEPCRDGTGDWTYTASSLDWLEGVRLPADKPSGTVHVAGTREPLFIPDARADDRVAAALVERAGVSSLLFQPVLDGDTCVGVLLAAWPAAAAEPDERRLQLLALAADEAAIAIERRFTMRRLQRAALRDPLTGTANRRAFDDEYADRLRVARDTDRRLTVMLLDLNDFKAVNDGQGHQAGDELLIATAAAWLGALRGDDFLARLGGDEFAVLLFDCDEVAAEPLARRLREATPHPAGVGIGAATWREGESADALLKRADEALYADKAAATA